MRLPPRVHEEVRQSQLVAFSCKSRAWCPSCGARRAHETAQHLGEVLPHVPYRQWTLALPFGLRFLLVKEPKLLRLVERRLVESIFRWQRRRARALGARGKRLGGAVCFAQLFGSVFQLSPHLQLLAAEGVWSDVVQTRAKYGRAIADLEYAIEPPFVVWGDGGGKPDTRTVRWTVKQLEAQYFSERPKGTYDIFLFDGAESYTRHAKAMFGEEPGTPYGYASSVHKALVMNIATGGGNLVHEIVHPYVAANFDDAPKWLNEGLASLYEQSSERDGRIVGLPNWRLEGLQRALARGPIMPFAKRVQTSDAQFRDENEGLHYAQARYLMQYLQEEGLLQDFVQRALKQQHEDPTASRALRQTLGETRWRTLDATWRKWVMGLRFP